MDSELSGEQIDRINAAVFAGRKIEAIKLYRGYTDCGLKEAKEFVETLQAQLREQMPEKFTANPNSGCTVSSAMLLGAAGVGFYFFLA
ncbi:MAG: ribosomal protein L7/L12 [Pirellulales bacterium]